MDYFPDSEPKREALYHAALIDAKKLRIGYVNADKRTQQLLLEHGTFERIFAQENVPVKDGLVRIIEGSPDFSVMRISDDSYPEALKEEGRTPVLYYRGNQELLDNKSMAVVGTRRTQFIDYNHAQHVLERLLKKEYTIVSGLASGSDTIGHTYAVEHGGNTIAVLGTPLNRSYPRENQDLQEKIAQEHLLVSQYPVGAATFPYHFKHRNITTVSLASDGLLVVHSPDGSGTLHAIREAHAQRKEIYALANNFNKGYNWVKKISPKRVGRK